MRKVNFFTYVTLIAFIIFFTGIFFGLTGDLYLIFGNIHDTFIPLNSAHAWRMGEQFNETFHSPFGIIYHLMNYVSLSLILSFPETLNTLDIFYLTSILFTSFLFVLFALMRMNEPPGSKMPIWVLFFAVVLVFQLRNPDSFGQVKLLWYGSYNFQLWALLILQISHCFTWTKASRSDSNVVLFGVIQAICLGVCFNYKINFFAASGLICLAPLLFMSLRQSIIYTVTGVAVFVATAIMIHLFGYSYSGYFSDLKFAIESKQSGPIVGSRLLAFFLLFVTMMQAVRYNIFDQNSAEGKLTNRMKAFLISKILPVPGSRLLMFDMLVGFSLLLAAAGDFTRPNIYFIVVVFIFVFWKRGEDVEPIRLKAVPYKFILIILVTMFVGKNIQAIAIFAKAKTWEVSTSIRDSGWLTISTINGGYQPLNFITSDDVTFNSILDNSIIEMAKDWRDQMVELSYSTYETRESTQTALIINSNKQYVQDLNMQLDEFSSLGIDYGTQERIMNLGYVNPFPFLLGAPFPDNSFHWKHLGTTVSLDDIDTYFRDMINTDFVVMPVAAIDRSKQNYVNCSFYIWNHENGSNFIGYSIKGRTLFFVSREKAQEYGLVQAFDVDINRVREACPKVGRNNF